MPDIQIEKESKFKKLSKENRDEFARKISDWWGELHDRRKSQIETARRIEKEIFLNQPDRNRNKEWKSNIKENLAYTIWLSMKSLIWKESWSNEEQMFDTQGTSK